MEGSNITVKNKKLQREDKQEKKTENNEKNV